MARFIPENIIDEVLDRTDIVELISSYIPLKHVGKSFKALCPFHTEKTPSFIVSPAKQIYHCFGCNTGGNAYSFITNYEKVDFPEAVKLLADKCGIRLPETDLKFEGSSIYTKLRKVNELASNFYHTNLLNKNLAKDASLYLDKRGISKDIITKFKLGYAPDGWSSFLDYAKSKGYKEDILEKSGFIIKGKNNTYYDRFRDRLIFPIFDVKGYITGFGARVLKDESPSTVEVRNEPKYINSPETLIYNKSKILYGLSHSRDFIREKKNAIVVEGYMDYLACFQYGITNVVASSGTALTKQQALLLKRYTDTLILVYDSDNAGQLATLRNLDILLTTDLQVKIVTLPQSYDPDDFLREKGREEFDKLMNSAENFINCKFNILAKQYNIDDPYQKTKICEEILLSIANIQNPILAAEYVKELSESLKISEQALLDKLKNIKTAHKVVEDFDATDHRQHMEIEMSEAEKILLRAIIENKDTAFFIRERINYQDFPSQYARDIFKEIFTLIDSGKDFTPKNLINKLEQICSFNNMYQNFISEIMTKQLMINHINTKIIEDCINWIKKGNLKQKRFILKEKIKKAQKDGEKSYLDSLLEEFSQLTRSSK